MNISPLQHLIETEKNAREYGFDWPNVEMLFAQIISECDEIKAELQSGSSRKNLQMEIGDLIHCGISLCMFLGLDATEAIAMTADKFAKRMQAVKDIAATHGHENLQGQSFDYMLEIWREAKQRAG